MKTENEMRLLTGLRHTRPYRVAQNFRGTCLAIACSLLAAGSISAQESNTSPGQRVAAEAPDAQTPEATDETPQNGSHKRGIQHEVIVTVGRDVELKAGNSAKVVVVIGGSA